MNNQLNSIDYRDIAVDSLNRVWAASWGGGIAVFDQSQNNIKISFINSENGKLAGIVDNPNYVVTVGVHCDRQGNMWILNRQANNLRVLAVVDSMDNWQYFSTLDGIASTLLESFEIDLYGRKWIGTEDRGITVLDDNGTVFDKSDDDLNQGLTTVDGLESMHIRALASDVFGTNWIGTPEGLNYWSDGNVGIRYSVINDDINCIKVDARNNKWIGTSGGISVLNADGFSWQHYSTSNSPLISDNVTCFAFNENNGDVFIGTTEGLSRLETPYSRAKKTLAFVNGYPNPFILVDKPGAKYVINNLAENSSVRFFTPDGALIKRIPQSRILGSQVTWDGKNEKGDLVASGIYIYLVRADGDTRVGKVAVINP
jgi:ligand-binding sensor domain-containing protein